MNPNPFVGGEPFHTPIVRIVSLLVGWGTAQVREEEVARLFERVADVGEPSGLLQVGEPQPLFAVG
jgi:hypothetical protein